MSVFAQSSKHAVSLPDLLDISQEVDKIEKKYDAHLIAFQIMHHQKMITSLQSGICFPIIIGKKSLKVGDENRTIPYVRYLLKTMGYPIKNVDIQEFDKQLEKGVLAFQKHHFLKEDGVIGPHTQQKLIFCFHQRVKILNKNVKKLQELSHQISKGTQIIVNVPTFTLFALFDGQIELVSRVIVGKPSQATPEMVSNILAVIANPTWGVPPGIMKRSTLPRIRKNPDYLNNRGFVVTDAFGQRVDPASVNWHDADSYGQLKIRQRSGRQNALGLVKLQLDNKKMIYLHDTPNKELFKQNKRDLSSGCVRVQKIEELARWVLAKNESKSVDEFQKNLTKGRNSSHKLEKPIPVHLIYLTTWADKHGNILWNDPYQRT